MNEDLSDPRPLYVQLADSLRTAIARGDFKVGDKLPSYAELGSKHAVSHMTVKQAIAELKRDGTVTARQGMGVFVRAQPPRRQDTELDSIRARLELLEKRVHAIEDQTKKTGDR